MFFLKRYFCFYFSTIYSIWRPINDYLFSYGGLKSRRFISIYSLINLQYLPRLVPPKSKTKKHCHSPIFLLLRLLADKLQKNLWEKFKHSINLPRKRSLLIHQFTATNVKFLKLVTIQYHDRKYRTKEYVTRSDGRKDARPTPIESQSYRLTTREQREYDVVEEGRVP